MLTRNNVNKPALKEAIDLIEDILHAEDPDASYNAEILEAISILILLLRA